MNFIDIMFLAFKRPEFIYVMMLLLCQYLANGFLSSSGTTKRKMSSLLYSATTPIPKYPTGRGETVDSRDIVASQRPPLLAVRLLHILFATELMASQSLYDLRLSSDFATLASQVSMCTLTRDEGGTVGWVNVAEIEFNNNTKTSSVNDHLNDILPVEARKQVLRMNTKVRK